MGATAEWLLRWFLFAGMVSAGLCRVVRSGTCGCRRKAHFWRYRMVAASSSETAMVDDAVIVYAGGERLR